MNGSLVREFTTQDLPHIGFVDYAVHDKKEYLCGSVKINGDRFQPVIVAMKNNEMLWHTVVDSIDNGVLNRLVPVEQGIFTVGYRFDEVGQHCFITFFDYHGHILWQKELTKESTYKGNVGVQTIQVSAVEDDLLIIGTTSIANEPCYEVFTALISSDGSIRSMKHFASSFQQRVAGAITRKNQTFIWGSLENNGIFIASLDALSEVREIGMTKME